MLKQRFASLGPRCAIDFCDLVVFSCQRDARPPRRGNHRVCATRQTVIVTAL